LFTIEPMKLKTLLLTLSLLPFLISAPCFSGPSNSYQKEDYKTSFSEWKPLADKGYANAQYNIGWMYGAGSGVSKDNKQAVKWYRKAADQGYADAQYNLGLMHIKGEGVFKDDKEAARLFHRAADQGVADAQYNLALMYDAGAGVSRDLSKAKYWIKKAYENPDANAATVENSWDRLKLWK